MNELPLVSIIVPAYNSERWLVDCCGSVFGQTYPNIELIIVDDGSSDGTYDLAIELAYGKPNVHVIHMENGGVSRARNAGLEAASGAYIAFLDADDILIDNAIEVLYSKLISENAEIAIGWKSNMTSDGMELGCPYEPISGVFDGKEGLKLSLEDHPSMYAVWGKLYKREAIADVRFEEGKRAHEDSFFVFECLLKRPRVIVCDNIVIHYRLSENSASRSSFSNKYNDILYFANQKSSIIKERYPEFLSLAENVIVKANMAVLWNLLRTKDPQCREIEKKAIKDVLARRKYYKSASKSDAKLFWILTHRLYGVCKLFFVLRDRLNMLRDQ